MSATAPINTSSPMAGPNLVNEGLDYLARGEPQHAIVVFRRAAGYGDADGQYYLADTLERNFALFNGSPIMRAMRPSPFDSARDPDLTYPYHPHCVAVEWYMEAIKSEHPLACLRLAEIRLELATTSPRRMTHYYQAEHLLRIASTQNYPPAQYALAMFCLNNKRQTPETTLDAISWLKKAASFNYMPAIEYLHYMRQTAIRYSESNPSILTALFPQTGALSATSAEWRPDQAAEARSAAVPTTVLTWCPPLVPRTEPAAAGATPSTTPLGRPPGL